jgi:hypothetical protein
VNAEEESDTLRGEAELVDGSAVHDGFTQSCTKEGKLASHCSLFVFDRRKSDKSQINHQESARRILFN